MLSGQLAEAQQWVSGKRHDCSPDASKQFSAVHVCHPFKDIFAMTITPLQCVDHSKPLLHSSKFVHCFQHWNTANIQHQICAALLWTDCPAFQVATPSYPIHWLYLNKRYICTSLWYDNLFVLVAFIMLITVCVTVLMLWQRWCTGLSVFPAIRVIRISTTLYCTHTVLTSKLASSFRVMQFYFPCVCVHERERYAPDVEKFLIQPTFQMINNCFSWLN